MMTVNIYQEYVYCRKSQNSPVKINNEHVEQAI